MKKLHLLVLKIGDALIVALSILIILQLFQTLWTNTPATKVQISLAGAVIGTYSLNQARNITVHGKLGESVIEIAHGQARFVHSPCQTQYCVHQGWLKRAGQVAICLPNQVSLTLLGDKKLYDSLNY